MALCYDMFEVSSTLICCLDLYSICTVFYSTYIKDLKYLHHQRLRHPSYSKTAESSRSKLLSDFSV